MMLATPDGIDPAVLVPVVCLLVGLALGYLLRWAVERRTIRRLQHRLNLFASLLDAHTAHTTTRGAIPTITTQDSQT
jgi:hypothetical protein